MSRLAPGRLGTRYRRLRWACDLDDRLREFEFECDDHHGEWGEWDSYEEAHWRFGKALDDWLAGAVQRMHACGFSHRLPLPEPVHAPRRSEPALVREDLEARVLAHFGALMGEPHEPMLEVDGADAAMLARLGERLTDAHAPSMAALLLVRPFWLRPLVSWSGHTSESLVEHLLVAYPAPRSLLRAWCEPVDFEVLRWMAWSIVLGQGGSLARFGELAHAAMPELWAPVPGKLAHALARVPDSLRPREGVVLAELLRLRAGERELALLRRDGSYLLDFTGPIDPGELEFWRSTVAWLVRHREATDAELLAILTWARHEQTERARRGGVFEWRGRTVASAHRDALAYQATFARPWLRHLTWKPRGWDWQGEREGATWTIRELTSSAALRAESQAMAHCVHGYDLACWRGDTAIFSVCRDGQRCVTIEVRTSDRNVVQAKRARNQAPSPAELEVIAGWAATLSPHSDR